ncbi:hypothetical protein HDU85_005839 [Gaertneriomyces sp. JEL0708]|nr:hypothetical protein HDU85_005839 [Gaertneriomyces sp. JEL0708]
MTYKTLSDSYFSQTDSPESADWFQFLADSLGVQDVSRESVDDWWSRYVWHKKATDGKSARELAVEKESLSWLWEKYQKLAELARRTEGSLLVGVDINNADTIKDAKIVYGFLLRGPANPIPEDIDDKVFNFVQLLHRGGNAGNTALKQLSPQNSIASIPASVEELNEIEHALADGVHVVTTTPEE